MRESEGKHKCRCLHRRSNNKMKFYISTTGIKRVTISNSGTGKRSSAPAAALAGRRIPSSRTLLPVVLVLGIVLPFLFVRVAFLVLESSAVCSSSLGNIPLIFPKKKILTVFGLPFIFFNLIE